MPPSSAPGACLPPSSFSSSGFLPMIPMSEIRMMLPQAKVRPEPEPLEAGD